MNPNKQQTNENQNQNQDLLGSLSPSDAKDMLTGILRNMLEANKEEMKKDIVETVDDRIVTCMDKAKKEQLDKLGWPARVINNHPTISAYAMGGTTVAVLGYGAVKAVSYGKDKIFNRGESTAGDGLIAAITGGGFSFIGG